MKNNREKKIERIGNWLQIIASIFAILGISILTVSGPLKSVWKPFRVNEAEKQIEQIKVTESEDVASL